jgi:hypothetical protein
MKDVKFKKIPCIVWCLALNACVWLCWYAATPTLINSYNSPQYVYRLELYNASLLQRIVHYDLKEPSLVRLHRVWPKALLKESAVVDFSAGAEIDWHLDPSVDRGSVRVGQYVLFKDIPPECIAPSPMPGCPATKP